MVDYIDIIIDTTIQIWNSGYSGKLFLGMCIFSFFITILFFIDILWEAD